MRPALLLPAGYRDAVLATPGLVGYWPLDEANGVVARDAMGANHGTYVNAPTLGIPGPLVDPTTAVTFAAGALQKVTLGMRPALPAGASDRTVSAWIRTSLAGTTYWLWCGSLATAQVFAVGLSATGGIQVGIYGEEVAIRAGYADGAWHQVFVTFTGPRLVKAFVGGAMVGSGSFSQDLNTVVSEFGLANFASTGYWDGSLAHPAIWNRALTAAEVRVLHDVALGR